MTCPNCTTEGSGTYCENCGQSLRNNRITWKYFFGEIQQRIFGFDNKFARTIKDLTVRPEKVINAVIEGIQVRYFGPLGYYFLLVTIYVILISILDVDLKALSDSMYLNPESTPDDRAAGAGSQFGSLFFENFRLFSLLMLPFFILGTFILFRNKGLNFLETGVLVLYSLGHPLWLSLFTLIILKFFNYLVGQEELLLIGLLYFCWVCARFYSGNKWWNFIKGLFAQILSFVFLMIFAMLGAFVYLLLFPDAAKNFAP